MTQTPNYVSTAIKKYLTVIFALSMSYVLAAVVKDMHLHLKELVSTVKLSWRCAIIVLIEIIVQNV